MIRVRPTTPEDWETIQPWWTERGVEAPHPNLLPWCSGAIVEDEDGRPFCCAFLMMVLGCGQCHIEEFISRPNTGPRKVREAGLLIDEMLCGLAKNQGYSAVYSNCARPSMANELKKRGFAKVLGPVVIMGKTI